jgi:HD-GYP domain-containing protein (c-di-GMP phosphodiesterase class II)
MAIRSPLLIKFTALSLVATALTAAGIGWFVGQHLVDSAVKEAVHNTVDIVQRLVGPGLTRDAFGPPTPEQVAAWAERLGRVIGRRGITRIKVWNASGEVVYATNRLLIGRIFPVDREDQLRQALRTGQVVTDSPLGEPPARGGSVTPLMEIYAPVVLPGSPQIVGAYEIARTAAGLRVRVAETRRFVWQAWAGAFSLLYASLFGFVAWAGRRLLRQQEDLRTAFVGTVRALVSAVDFKDTYTASHSSRVAEYAAQTAAVLGLSAAQIDDIRMAPHLHDLGKIGVPDRLLQKPEPLTAEEGRQMRRHSTIAAHILENVPFSERIKLAVRHNHERWDDTGYPDGLAGEEIPIEARVLSVADAYEAMTSDRPYRPTLGHEEALAELRRYARTQFDPRVVQAFVHAMEQRRTAQASRVAPAIQASARSAV